MNIQSWFPQVLTDLISLQSKGLSGVFSSTIVQKPQFLALSLLYDPNLTSIGDYWKNSNSEYLDLCWQSNVSASNMLSRFVIAFLPRSKCLLISRLQPPSAVILETNKIISIIVFTYFPSVCHEVMGLDAMILVFWMLNFKPAFSLSSLPSSRDSLVPLHFLPLQLYHLHIWDRWCVFWQSECQLVIHLAQHFT